MWSGINGLSLAKARVPYLEVSDALQGTSHGTARLTCSSNQLPDDLKYAVSFPCGLLGPRLVVTRTTDYVPFLAIVCLDFILELNPAWRARVCVFVCCVIIRGNSIAQLNNYYTCRYDNLLS